MRCQKSERKSRNCRRCGGARARAHTHTYTQDCLVLALLSLCMYWKIITMCLQTEEKEEEEEESCENKTESVLQCFRVAAELRSAYFHSIKCVNMAVVVSSDLFFLLV